MSEDFKVYLVFSVCKSIGFILAILSVYQYKGFNMWLVYNIVAIGFLIIAGKAADKLIEAEKVA